MWLKNRNNIPLGHHAPDEHDVRQKLIQRTFWRRDLRNGTRAPSRKADAIGVATIDSYTGIFHVKVRLDEPEVNVGICPWAVQHMQIRQNPVSRKP
ncbi:hypothetical protein BD410DRAFT_796289 [Rickenella mellea]|uniref:Uncharacterized protein n=1 Tax=Rickenella mellea TaxID=50990 RepID=A0A4Y7PKB1_9AGAM|nr:hypothetical protein BD410DRAFT_796289 [Rickenella mellea]